MPGRRKTLFPKYGVLYSDGEVASRATLYDAMFSFMNGHLYAREWGDTMKPVRLVKYNRETKEWEHFVPSDQQIKACQQAVVNWYRQQEAERRYRE